MMRLFVVAEVTMEYGAELGHDEIAPGTQFAIGTPWASPACLTNQIEPWPGAIGEDFGRLRIESTAGLPDETHKRRGPPRRKPIASAGEITGSLAAASALPVSWPANNRSLKSRRLHHEQRSNGRLLGPANSANPWTMNWR